VWTFRKKNGLLGSAPERGWSLVVLLCFTFGLVLIPAAHSAEEAMPASDLRRIQPFEPGETLTYDISWSNIVTAGIATMTVNEDTLGNGRKVLVFTVKGHTTSLVDKFYPVDDTVQSVFDPLIMQSLSYSLHENYGRKKRNRVVVFDHANKNAVSTLNNDPPQSLVIPDEVQDGLSFLYYLRSREDTTTGKPITIEVLDSGQNWSVEVYTLGREKVKTSAGEFSTIKIKTYPKYKGVFKNKGEVFIWLTDDIHRVPVLMKSKLAFGSFVFTLTSLTLGKGRHLPQ
jgi:Protein of unknown function (DUF3108)